MVRWGAIEDLVSQVPYVFLVLASLFSGLYFYY